MNKLIKRIAPSFLALVMCLSLACISVAYAAPAPGSADAPENANTTQDDIKAGRTKYLITGGIVLVVGGGFYVFLNQKTKTRKRKK